MSKKTNKKKNTSMAILGAKKAGISRSFNRTQIPMSVEEAQAAKDWIKNLNVYKLR